MPCCRKSELLTENKYLIPKNDNTKLMIITKYQESNPFPPSLREFFFCPYCGRSVKEHSDNANKDFCLPFFAGANPEHGQFVCELRIGEMRKSLFTLVADSEKRDSYAFYPVEASIGFCPYCGKQFN
jgi:hypothetical protein